MKMRITLVILCVFVFNLISCTNIDLEDLQEIDSKLDSLRNRHTDEGNREHLRETTIKDESDFKQKKQHRNSEQLGSGEHILNKEIMERMIVDYIESQGGNAKSQSVNRESVKSREETDTGFYKQDNIKNRIFDHLKRSMERQTTTKENGNLKIKQMDKNVIEKLIIDYLKGKNGKPATDHDKKPVSDHGNTNTNNDVGETKRLVASGTSLYCSYRQVERQRTLYYQGQTYVYPYMETVKDCERFRR